MGLGYEWAWACAGVGASDRGRVSLNERVSERKRAEYPKVNSKRNPEAVWRAELHIGVDVIPLAGIPRGQPSSKITSKMFHVAELIVGDIGPSADECDVLVCAAPPMSVIFELSSRSRSHHICPGPDIEGASYRH